MLIPTARGNTEGLGTHLKCLCTNTLSTRNKQDELEELISSQSYDIFGIRLDGMSPTTGVLGWRATGYSGGLGRAGEVEKLHCV